MCRTYVKQARLAIIASMPYRYAAEGLKCMRTKLYSCFYVKLLHTLYTLDSRRYILLLAQYQGGS